MKMKPKYLAIFITLFLTGCGTAWVVERHDGGGTIGYKDYRDAQSAIAAIEKLIPQSCGPYNVVDDHVVDGGPDAMASLNLAPLMALADSTGPNGQGNMANNYSPPPPSHKMWREVTYSCSSAQYSASTNHLLTSDKYADCVNNCKRAWSAPKWISDCVKETCH